MTERGELSLVLNTHMPYVEGFGTWPFGEEWLWEAMATSYLPLLELLEAGAPLTLSLTPVLCDQLEAPGVGERFEAFLRDIRRETHARDVAGLREGGETVLADEVARAAGDYERAQERFAAMGGDLLGRLLPHAAWTSSATHAVLPLLATDAGTRLQVATGIDAHRRRGAPWRGGFWLPECGHASWLEPLLGEAGVHATCVDLTDVLGPGAPAHLRPLSTPAGLALVPIDRATIELVWGAAGYPAHGAYRDYHHHTLHHHRPWANDGSAYNPEAALRLTRRHAADFVDRVRSRAAGGGLCVCALDTELLGHWWYEGIAWLGAVLDEAAREGLAIVHLDDALERHQPADQAAALREHGARDSGAVGGSEPADIPITTWGTPRDLSTWDGPAVADLAWRSRAAELRVVARGAEASPRALRELLALQASDWAFMASRGLAGPYGRERADGHASALDGALALDSAPPAALRNLAPHLRRATLLVP
ncbi:MAG: 1,4-alpha-glucan branching protein domain-containing protein [Solirubrobacteraceae bacterium]